MYQQDQVRITKLLMMETGTYNQQYRRPYETSLDGRTLQTMAERFSGVTKFVPAILSGLANQFIAPTAAWESELVIPNGWTEKRLRFMMEVTFSNYAGGMVREVILGYTDVPGITVSNAVDPYMEFYVNSTTQTREIVEQTPFGAQTHVSAFDSSHILVDNGYGGIHSNNKTTRMRPEDVYAVMGRNHLDTNAGDIYDTRTSLSNQAVKSSRSNGLAANYAAKILDSYNGANNTCNDFGQSTEAKYQTARVAAADPVAQQDMFLSAIASIRQSPIIGNTFRMADLRMLDPNVDNVTRNAVVGATQQQSHYAGQTMDWSGGDRTTQVATILSHSIPSLLMDLALTKISFTSENRHRPDGQPLTVIQNLRSFSTGDLQRYGDNFIYRFEMEVLRDITYNNQIGYEIEMHVDLLGESFIRIALDGGGVYDYVTPSFSDAQMVPVLTNNAALVKNLSSDFEVLFENLNDAHAVPGSIIVPSAGAPLSNW